MTPEEIAARLRAAGCVFAEDEAALLAAAPGDLAALVARRVAGEPLEQVLGWAAFCGLRLVVEPGVFVPRRRTALLVREALAVAGPGATVVDLCCGVGAIAAGLAAARDGLVLHAADVDPVAVRCARRNLAGWAEVHEGDLYAALPPRLRGRVDLVVVNAPYVPTGELALLPPEARLHEPRHALDGGPDGLDVQRRVVDGAAGWLGPGGAVLVETSAGQALGTRGLMAARGLRTTVVRDLTHDATVVLGRLDRG